MLLAPLAVQKSGESYETQFEESDVAAVGSTIFVHRDSSSGLGTKTIETRCARSRSQGAGGAARCGSFSSFDPGEP